MAVDDDRRAELLASLDSWISERRTNNDATADVDFDVFRRLYEQFLTEPAVIDWGSWSLPAEHRFVDSADLPSLADAETKALLDRIAVVRLNGGLGTTMGCKTAKSLITVKEGKSFLQIAVEQVEKLNLDFGSRVPLLLMDSFNTLADTKAALPALTEGLVTTVRQFEQAKCPRIFADSLLPVPFAEGTEALVEEVWYPPGHGNIFETLLSTGLADELLAEGRDVLFVSNIDNTGATVDVRFAQALLEGEREYVMEVTAKTHADIKGGTLIEIEDGRLMHLEMPQVPPEGLEQFCSTEVFTIFNTNNIWLNLGVIRPRLAEIKREIIANKKKLSDGRAVVQLETSIGGAIRNFPKACGLVVGRHRFLPVKRTQDLLLVASDVFTLDDHGRVALAEGLTTSPPVSLSAEFDNLADFRRRFKSIPSLKQVERLTVKGDVSFGENVVLKGCVWLETRENEEFLVSDDAVIEDNDPN